MMCPYCRKNPSASKPLWPFCSARCKEADLGKWAKEEYRIAGKELDDESALDEILPDTGREEDD